ncbi:MAG: triose-phosphate isomerase [bacterium]|nr:triose-phosphate isomerase [bacterium]
MSRYIIAGNWKMFKSVKESLRFVEELNKKLDTAGFSKSHDIECLVFPPATSLYPVKNICGSIKIGAQNFFYEEKGAFTGEISPLMLEKIADYILIGHSERRELFLESDDNINKKIKAALKYGFTPLLCIGETLEEREAGNTFSKVQSQLDKDLDGLTYEEINKIVIAYEPIWAIGTGKTATPDQAQNVHAHIRKILEEKIGNKSGAESMKILYGGSVKPANSYEILSKNDINGVLVGGASLKVDSFFDIIVNSSKLVQR